MIEARCNYGPLRKGRDYEVLETGRDWYLIKVRGKAIYVFKWVFEDGVQ